MHIDQHYLWVIFVVLCNMRVCLLGFSVLPGSHSQQVPKKITQRVCITYKLIGPLAQASY